MHPSFSRAVDIVLKENDAGGGASRNARGGINDDESTLAIQSINLLQDDVDGKSQDSEETELPSQQLQFSSLARQVTTTVTTTAVAGTVRRGLQQQDSHSRIENSTSFAGYDSISGIQRTPPAASTISKSVIIAASEKNSAVGTSPNGSLQQLAGSPRVLPFQSPTTQGMMELSQDMDKMQYPNETNSPSSNAPKKIGGSSPAKKTSTAKTTSGITTTKKKTVTKKTTSVKTSPPKAAVRPAKDTSAKDNSNVQDRVEYEIPAAAIKDWNLIPIRIPTSERRSLGIAIVRSTFPGLPSQPRKQHCVVKRIIEDDLIHNLDDEVSPQSKPRKEYCGKRHGLREGDWFLAPGPDYMQTNRLHNPLILADFSDITEWSKQKPYQEMFVLRRRQQESVLSPTRPPANRIEQVIDNSTSQKASQEPKKKPNKAMTKPAASKKQTSKPFKPQDNAKADDDIANVKVAFCNRCNAVKKNKKKLPRLHHAWCPKNHCFDNSGADDIMIRIVQGCKLECPACEQEFRTGKPIPKKKASQTSGGNYGEVSVGHTDACVKNQNRLDREQVEREKREIETEDARLSHRQAKQKKQDTKNCSSRQEFSTAKKKLKASKALHGKSKNSTSVAPKQGPKRCLVDLDSSSSSSEEDLGDVDDDVSVYEPSQKRSRIVALGISKSTGNAKATKKTKRGSSMTVRRSHSQSSIHSQVSGKSLQEYDPSLSITGNDQSELDWVSLDDDPWGSEGYEIGDVALYGPERGQGHHEVELPSNRYKVDPFEVGSKYRVTHCLPEDGFSLVSLTRDSLGKIPWGFKVERDEFDHACLVTAVNQNSPASAALYVGASNNTSMPSSGLNVHDMLVMINGKQVGGMTEVGLSIELEISAPMATLVISRYKHAEKALRMAVALERQLLSSIDAAVKDNRLIGWQEIGNDVGQKKKSSEAEAANILLAKGDGNRLEPVAVENQAASQLSNKANVTVNLPLEDSDSLQTGSHTRKNESVHAPGIESDGENTEDGSKAWLGCVCGKIHSDQKRMFWIECEDCKAWYDVAEKCIGFSQEDAKRMTSWVCEACEPLDDSDEETNDKTASPTLYANTSTSEVSPAEHRFIEGKIENTGLLQTNQSEIDRKKQKSESWTSQATSPNTFTAKSLAQILDNSSAAESPLERSSRNEKRGSCPSEGKETSSEKEKREKSVAASSNTCQKKKQTTAKTTRAGGRSRHFTRQKEKAQPVEADDNSTGFKIGELVEVTPHAWPGVNVTGGVGRVVAVNVDGDGDRHYDIKYILARFKEKEIYEKFINRHSFG